MAPTFSISAVARATGLTAHTIRAWEKRYQVTSPDRTKTNRRKYDEGDIERFKLLKRAIGNGHSIGMIASLTNTELEKIASATSQSEKPGSDRDYLGACVRAMMDIDSTRLEDELSKAVLVLGIDRFLEEVVVPFLHELDKGWEQQSISIAQEHLASALLRTQLDRVRLSIHVPASAPRILVTTPSGQIHEIGALLAAIFAARQGWNVTYLGPNLPAEEIAIAAAKTHSKAVGLSLVYPENDPLVKSELIKIRQLLPTTPIIIGGRAASNYSQTIQAIGAHAVIGEFSLKQLLHSLS